MYKSFILDYAKSVPIISSPPTLAYLMRDVAKPAPDQWKNIARQLGLQEPLISAFDQECRGIASDCYSKVFCEWEQNCSSPYTWNQIIEALHYIERPDIIDDIVKRHGD